MSRAPLRMFWTFALFILGVYASLLLFLYLMQERLIFIGAVLEPERAAQLAGQRHRIEPVTLEPEPGISLRGWYRRAEAGRSPAILYFGGNAEEVSWTLAESSVPEGFSWLALNYRGYGASTGRADESALYRDAEHAFDYLAARPDVDPAGLVVFGRSLGSGVATHVATVRPVRAVVLVTPFDSLVRVAARHYPYAPVAALLRHRFDSLGRAGRIRAPALVLAAATDDIIPPAHARRLCSAWAGDCEFVEFPGRGHNDLSDDPAYWPRIAAFLQRTR